jgi:uncharacterized protein
LVDDILYKDIVGMHGIKEVQKLKDFFVLLMERAGKVASINKLGRILDVQPDTSRRWLKMFEDTYLIYTVVRYGRTNESLLSAKKIYAADLGIRNAFTGLRDKGSYFENYLYLKLRGLSPRYVYQDGNEIDFMTVNNTLVEVKYGLDMNQAQKDLFESFPAKKKIVINGVKDLSYLDSIE